MVFSWDFCKKFFLNNFPRLCIQRWLYKKGGSLKKKFFNLGGALLSDPKHVYLLFSVSKQCNI